MLKKLLFRKLSAEIVWILTITILLFFPELTAQITFFIERGYTYIFPDKEPSEEVVLITISEEDILSLGGWPLKRSYYASLINNLRKFEPSKIGIEIVLASSPTQKIYDNLLLNEIIRSGNVVLAIGTRNARIESGKITADTVIYPSVKEQRPDIVSGHILYFKVKGDKIIIPEILEQNGIKEVAFFRQLSGFKSDDADKKINFHSSWKKFRQYSFIEIFSLIRNNSPELKTLKGKIIIVGVTDNKFTEKISTHFDSEAPGLAIHAFAVDNTRSSSFINDSLYLVIPLLFNALLIAFILLKQNENKKIVYYIMVLMLFVIINGICFRYFSLELAHSISFIPILMLIAVTSLRIYFESMNEKDNTKSEAELLRHLLIKRNRDLALLEKKLSEYHGEEKQRMEAQIEVLKKEIEKMKSLRESDNDKISITEKTKALIFEGIVYTSRTMSGVINLIEKVAKSSEPVLIFGESGTGKELVARAIHQRSPRAKNNFIAVNCGALSETLLESELFGHVRGAFTGANTDKIGRFEAADKGTIFLDEIGEISENFQVKLLRVLQSGTFEKVGSSQTKKVDCRVIAASNKNLEVLVKQGKFREDLFYRLNVLKISIPALRERKEDIPFICEYIIRKNNYNIGISKAALDALVNYEWKGNIRELESVIKRALVFSGTSGKDMIQITDLPEEIVRGIEFSYEEIILENLRKKKFSHSSLTETAKELNVSRTVVSENFRGALLSAYLDAGKNKRNAAIALCGNEDESQIEKIVSKLDTFLGNIEEDVKKIGREDFEEVKQKLNVKYKNLPRKFHYALDELIREAIKKQ